MKRSKSSLRAILKGVDVTIYQCKYALERFLFSAANHYFGSTVIIMLWTCSVPSTAIIVFRLLYRPFKGVFDLGDWFAILSLILILARHGLQLSAFYLKTGMVTPEMHASLTPDDIEARILGSKVHFIGRVVFTSLYVFSQDIIAQRGFNFIILLSSTRSCSN